MTPDYSFYRETYLGESIDELSWPFYVTRASEELGRLSGYLTLTPRTDNAEGMTLCAMADALYYFDTAVNQRKATAVTIGAVSAQTSAPAVDISPKAQQAELMRCLRRFYDVERWCGC